MFTAVLTFQDSCRPIAYDKVVVFLQLLNGFTKMIFKSTFTPPICSDEVISFGKSNQWSKNDSGLYTAIYTMFICLCTHYGLSETKQFDLFLKRQILDYLCMFLFNTGVANDSYNNVSFCRYAFVFFSENHHQPLPLTSKRQPHG